MAYKMKKFSGFGNSPLKQDVKKKEYKKATNEQLEPYLGIKLDYETEPFLSDTIHPETRKLFTPGFVNFIGGVDNPSVKLLIGRHDLKQKGKLDK
jgi:hypothetical protein